MRKRLTAERLARVARQADRAGQLGLAVHLYALALWLKDGDGSDLPRNLDYDRAITGVVARECVPPE